MQSIQTGTRSASGSPGGCLHFRGVTLWGYQDSWSFDDIDWHEKLSLFARLDLSQPSVFWQLYDYEQCAEATAYNIMLDEEADALEENADLIGRVLKYV